jgi:hypothetical protein
LRRNIIHPFFGLNINQAAAHWYLVWMIFNPECRGDKFLRNLGSQTQYTALCPDYGDSYLNLCSADVQIGESDYPGKEECEELGLMISCYVPVIN